MTAFKLMAEIFDLPKADTWAHIWTLSLEREKNLPNNYMKKY